jgi:hypothetical protein
MSAVILTIVAIVAGLILSRLVPRPILMVLMVIVGALLLLIVGFHYHAIR